MMIPTHTCIMCVTLYSYLTFELQSDIFLENPIFHDHIIQSLNLYDFKNNIEFLSEATRITSQYGINRDELLGKISMTSFTFVGTEAYYTRTLHSNIFPIYTVRSRAYVMSL